MKVIKCPDCYFTNGEHDEKCLKVKSDKIKNMKEGRHTFREIDPRPSDKGGLSGKHKKIDTTKNIYGKKINCDYESVGIWTNKPTDTIRLPNNTQIKWRDSSPEIQQPLGLKLQRKRAGTFDRFENPTEHNAAVGVLMELFGRGLAIKNYNISHDLILYITYLIDGLRSE